MDETLQGYFLLWVQYTFRNVADRDYLAARLLSKNKLFQPSIWSSLQAVEKYLKGIMLFSYQNIKKHKHDLVKLWQAIEKLPRLKAKIPPDCVEFLEYLSVQGTNRYLDFPLSLQGDELFKLDRCVWHIRRYCQNFFLLPGADILHQHESETMLAAIPEEASPRAVKSFRISGGYLEALLDEMKKPLRATLVWKNQYYGKNSKHRIHYAATVSWERPVHMIRPELLPIIEQVAYIPPEILNELHKYRDEKLKDEAGRRIEKG